MISDVENGSSEKKSVVKELPKVGVIVPAYNVEKYIGDCLESLIRQSYQNMVIAVVNDGSTDHTKEVIDKYCSRHDVEIRKLDTENKGPMQARFSGIGLLEDCEYVFFVDSDDFLSDSHIIEICIAHMQDVDMVCFNMEVKGKPCFKTKEIMELTPEQGIENILNRQYLDGNMTGTCFRYVHIKNHFRVLKCNNDDFINKAVLMEKCNKIRVLPVVGYFYRENQNSLTHGKMKEKDYLYFEHAQVFCRDMKKKYPTCQKAAEYFESWVLLCLVSGLCKHRESRELEIYKPAMRAFRQHSRYYVWNRYFSFKDRMTYVCIRFHLFEKLYWLYHMKFNTYGKRKGKQKLD